MEGVVRSVRLNLELRSGEEKIVCLYLKPNVNSLMLKNKDLVRCRLVGNYSSIPEGIFSPYGHLVIEYLTGEGTWEAVYVKDVWNEDKGDVSVDLTTKFSGFGVNLLKVRNERPVVPFQSGVTIRLSIQMWASYLVR